MEQKIMKYREPYQEGSVTILALILTLVLSSIYYTPEFFEESPLLGKLSFIEATRIKK